MYFWLPTCMNVRRESVIFKRFQTKYGNNVKFRFIITN
jgi:hypothetical protein